MTKLPKTITRTLPPAEEDSLKIENGCFLAEPEFYDKLSIAGLIDVLVEGMEALSRRSDDLDPDPYFHEEESWTKAAILEKAWVEVERKLRTLKWPECDREHRKLHLKELLSEPTT